jgi:uncharacterized protein (DUF3084 family)
MSFEGYQEALELQKHKEDELKTMQSQLNTVQSMLENLITGLSKTTDQQQFNTMTQSLLSSGVLKVAAPSASQVAVVVPPLTAARSLPSSSSPSVPQRSSTTTE